MSRPKPSRRNVAASELHTTPVYDVRQGQPIADTDVDSSPSNSPPRAFLYTLIALATSVIFGFGYNIGKGSRSESPFPPIATAEDIELPAPVQAETSNEQDTQPTTQAVAVLPIRSTQPTIPNGSRLWVDSRGYPITRAALIELRGDSVFLQGNGNGEISCVQISGLCDADRDYVDSLSSTFAL